MEAMKLHVPTPRQVREWEASEGKLYAELTAQFKETRCASQPTTKREAVARFTDVVYAFASAVLSAPADYTAHAVDYATGLLAEATNYVQAEMATRGTNNV